MNLADFFLNLLVPLIFQKTNVDDHINLRSTICHCIFRLKYFDRCGMISVRESDHGTDWKSALHILRRLLHIRCRYAGRCRMVLHGIIENFPDFLPCRRLRKQCMINLVQYFFSVHFPYPFLFAYFNSSKIELPIVPSGIESPKLSVIVAPIIAKVEASFNFFGSFMDDEYARNGPFSLV